MTAPAVPIRGRRRAPGPARISRSSASPAMTVTDSTVVVVEAMTVIGLICAWMVAHLLLFGTLAETRSQAVLYGQLRESLASATAPTCWVIVPGTPVSVMTIPAVGLQQVVVEGTASGELLKGPGHLRSSVLPGQAGNAVIFGRARSYGAPFAQLSRLRVGHAIYATTAQGQASYRVDAIRHAGDPVPQPLAAGAGRLTLVTAYTGGLLSALAPHEVIYIDASLVSKPYQAPGGGLNAVTPSELAMARDTTVMPALALALGLTCAAYVATLFARQRIAPAIVWILAAPTLLALTWWTAGLVMYLLPNLF